MHKPFDELRERLLRAGIAPRHVRRYLNELTDHLSDLRAEEAGEEGKQRSGQTRPDTESAALARLGSTEALATAMIEQRQFKSWSARAPWAVFGMAAPLALAAAYFVALFILWSGWRIFLPGSDSPFVRVNGLAVLYFQFGRTLYYGAPVLIGWGIGLLAARQRLNAIWPAVGLVVVALIGGSAEVHAGRTAVPGGLGHVGMNFALGASDQQIPGGLIHALIILLLAAAPYLIWRLQRSFSLPA